MIQLEAGPFITITVLIGTCIIILHTHAALPRRHGQDKDKWSSGQRLRYTLGRRNTELRASVSPPICVQSGLTGSDEHYSTSDKEIA